MKRKMLWLVVSGLMALSLLMAACGPAAVEEKKAPAVEEKRAPVVEEKKQEVPVVKEAVKPAAETPKYGGTVTLATNADVQYIDTIFHTVASITISPVNEELWGGDWTQGPAGGYGTNKTDWAGNYNLWHLNTGVVAESTKWTIDEAKNEGTIVYQIRQGIHYALDPKSEASRLVGGREFTPDDVIFHLKRVLTDPRAYINRSNPELKGAKITKTGPWEITVKVPLDALITAIDRFGDSMQFVPPEVVNKYGGQENWRNVVGTGPFILTDYVPGSTVVLTRNPNYWQQDPLGPGKGNQLPYLDTVRHLIIPDLSTRLAALRTGKIDQMTGLNWEDAIQIRKQAPALKEITGPSSGMISLAMRTDTPPFTDIRVRRAILMATDFESIHKSIANGQGQRLTRPSSYEQGYEDLYIGINDPDMPQSAKENFTYNPEKAKQLLKEAGYPNGFKTTVLATSAQVDELSIYKAMWAKVGIDLTIDVKDTGVYNAIVNRREHPALLSVSGNPNGVFHTQPSFTGISSTNRVIIDDPFINEKMAEVRRVAVTVGLAEAIKMTREATKRELELALEIPGPGGISSRFWWPWLKNYGGETSVGYFNGYWQKWVWIDQALKKSMGY